jgi:hypothetical protein
MYIAARRDGLDFNLAFIPDNFDLTPNEPFDPVYMRALYELGRGRALEGYPWAKAPPGM